MVLSSAQPSTRRNKSLLPPFLVALCKLFTLQAMLSINYPVLVTMQAHGPKHEFSLCQCQSHRHPLHHSLLYNNSNATRESYPLSRRKAFGKFRKRKRRDRRKRISCGGGPRRRNASNWKHSCRRQSTRRAGRKERQRGRSLRSRGPCPGPIRQPCHTIKSEHLKIIRKPHSRRVRRVNQQQHRSLNTDASSTWTCH